jgi:coenzyme F420-reducing hydrogenase beta subunit
MINIQNKVDCCGCNACGDVCAHHAITFKTDIEGFWYPEVDTGKCTDCGLCEKVCPIINIKDLKKNDLPQSICYAAEHKNLEVVFDSTSGGLFSALADIMYKGGGYVGGAVFNDDFSVRQYISNDKADLPRLRSSKYLQSRLDGFYVQVRDLLKKGEKVLVCGSPCQMAALRAFLRKDYENLIITRTLSKAFALAGIRCGFAVANENIIKAMLKVIDPYPIADPVAQIAVQALSDHGVEMTRDRVAKCNERRLKLKEALNTLPFVVKTFESVGNFILVEFRDGPKVFDAMVQKGVILRSFETKPGLKNCVRISIGSDAELEELMRYLKSLEI